MTDDLDPALIEDAYALQSHLGFRITGWKPDWARFEQPLEPYLMNRYGIPHGGIYATLLDTVMGFAGCYTGDPENRLLGMTLTLNTSFLARPEGMRLIAEGRRIGGGRSTFFAESEIRDELGTLCARGTGAFRYRKAS
ncbi:PaaI family thioesterase [Acidimangrovimonas sediminis]|uniref:PaaI family thioesterase n=1 Tax=Acidimangrovimonas sediminis TaxID=2056283 RepID=UPI000C807D5F|nr:PaaI family thioesterase [Acidimangrovimonas sediminis]